MQKTDINLKTGLILFFIFLNFTAIPIFAQSFYFDLNFAPNSSGQLEGNAIMGYQWNNIFYSQMSYQYTSFISEYNALGGDVVSFIDMSKFLLFPVALNEDFLHLTFSSGYVSASAGIACEYTLLNEKRYGTYSGFLSSVELFYLRQSLNYFKPYVFATMRGKVSILEFSGGINISFLSIDEHLTGEVYFSEDSGAHSYVYDEIGSELLGYGMIKLVFSKDFQIHLSFNYWQHNGTTLYTAYVNLLGFVQEAFDYTAEELKYTIIFKINIFGFKPLLGISYVKYTYTPMIDSGNTLEGLYSEYTSQRFQFLLGIDLKI